MGCNRNGTGFPTSSVAADGRWVSKTVRQLPHGQAPPRVDCPRRPPGTSARKRAEDQCGVTGPSRDSRRGRDHPPGATQQRVQPGAGRGCDKPGATSRRGASRGPSRIPVAFISACDASVRRLHHLAVTSRANRYQHRPERKAEADNSSVVGLTPAPGKPDEDRRCGSMDWPARILRPGRWPIALGKGQATPAPLCRTSPEPPPTPAPHHHRLFVLQGAASSLPESQLPFRVLAHADRFWPRSDVTHTWGGRCRGAVGCSTRSPPRPWPEQSIRICWRDGQIAHRARQAESAFHRPVMTCGRELKGRSRQPLRRTKSRGLAADSRLRPTRSSSVCWLCPSIRS